MTAAHTIEDIAGLAGVSVSTVSRVLNEHPDVSPKTRQRVLKIIEENNYVPNNSARNLKRESLHAVAIIVKGFTNSFFAPMIESIQEELEKRKYMVLLNPVDPDEDEVDSAISLNKEKKPEGIIFLGGNFSHPKEKLELLDVPCVMVTMTFQQKMDGAVFSSVGVNDYEEAYNVGKRIAAAGHKRVAAIGHLPDDNSISALRMNGLDDALREENVQLYTEYAGNFKMDGGYSAAMRLLDEESFTCLFCISDTLAIGAMRAIHDKGYKIPGDISVVGFDGITEAQYCIPSLATVRQPRADLARESIRMLLGCMENARPHQHKVLAAEFVHGESFAEIK